MQRLGAFFTRLAQRYLPSPFALACMLTLFVCLTALVFPQSDALRGSAASERTQRVVGMWFQGVWNTGFLEFGLQMCVVLLTGFGLARAPVAQRGLRRLARAPRTNRGAAGLVALCSGVGCWINWGFGLILAGILAVEVRQALRERGVRCQFALIVAAAYVGMMIWHGGLSGSAPLKVAADGVTIETTVAGVPQPRTIAPITVDATLLSRANLLLSAALIAGAALVFRALGAREVLEADDGDELQPAPPAPPEAIRPRTLAERLDHSRALPVLIAALLLAGVVVQVLERRHGGPGESWFLAGLRSLHLNTVNSLFLALGLMLHPSLHSYLSAVAEGGRAIVGIVLQFPLYGGIQGLMVGAGLAAALSEAFVGGAQSVAELIGVSPSHTFPLATLASAGLVNFFVPSGGGQWIVQGPIMCQAAEALHVPLAQTVMAVAYGDELTNMVQPFWALPLMGMTRVDARAFMGYCALIMLLAVPVFAAALMLY